jgi:flavin-binding monooxygenase-like protein
MRRGAYVIPKFIGGKPVDETSKPWATRLPLSIQRLGMKQLLKASQGRMTDYGLPEPDHQLLEAHPTVSSDLLPRIGHGEITVKPNLARFDGGEAVFADGTRERADVVVYCTGYRISFPFFARELISAPDNHVRLYHRVVDPEHTGLYFIGLLQPLGAVMPLAEAQAEWVADVLQGRSELPAPAEMRDTIARDEARMRERYVASKRHTIQVDFHPYLRTIARERRRRGAAAPPLSTPAR